MKHILWNSQDLNVQHAMVIFNLLSTPSDVERYYPAIVLFVRDVMIDIFEKDILPFQNPQYFQKKKRIRTYTSTKILANAEKQRYFAFNTVGPSGLKMDC